MNDVFGLIAAPPAPSVKVQRNGNSKVLPLPADLAREKGVDFGEIYSVVVAGDDVIYHRQTQNRVEIHGSGDARFGVISDDDVMGVPPRASVPALDWDF